MSRRKMIRILVVDDQESSRQMLVKVLSLSQSIQVIGTAVNGNDAIRKVSLLNPDLITLDLEMPGMDGFTFLRWLMKNRPTPVLIVSSNDTNRIVFHAMELGAVDFVVKPLALEDEAFSKFRRLILAKIRKIAPASPEKITGRIKLFIDPRTLQPIESASTASRIELVIIGASTGGPPAIHHIITMLPDHIKQTILVIQHMPRGFTRAFAERLSRVTNLVVKEAVHGEPVRKGEVIVAPGGYHVRIEYKGNQRCYLLDAKKEQDTFCPSIDRCMESAALLYGSRVMGVLLTGMGNDGAEGMRRIRQSGGKTIAESEKSAIVFGMPREAIRNHGAEFIDALEDIPGRIISFL